MAISLEKAQEILLSLTKPLPTEKIELEKSWRRILAETVVSGTDFPPFDRSPLDGYALIAQEVEGATQEKPVFLKQIDYVPAGSVATQKVIPGTACRIMTGAPLPKGATGVVRIEDTRLEEEKEGKEDIVAILDGQGAGKNICKKGEEILSGEEIIASGTVINAGAMGMLAMLGNSQPLVFKKPRVVLISTGSEIIPVDAPLEPGKIRNSNSYMLAAQVLEAGGEPILLGNVPDRTDEIIGFLEKESDCDIFITTGGASVGDYDLIGQVYQKMGIELLFERINIKPGMPVLAGLKNDKLYIGLSGNPAAASVSFEQLVRLVIMKMSGRKNLQRPLVKAILEEPFPKRTDAKRFVWSKWRQSGDNAGQIVVAPHKAQGNGMLMSAMEANSIIIVPENSPPLPVGSTVEVILLDSEP